ncbi:MAG: ABC transporter permease [Betaproteobacteria bacterium]|nr:ABC transporter permease [Betaproteobacteria bacterium]
MFHVQPVVLWTDALVFVLLVVVISFGWLSHRHEPLREPWRKVARSRGGMASATVLAFFVAVGLLDSFHYQTAESVHGNGTSRAAGGEVLSVLDALAMPLKLQTERTFSAPFATHAFAKEAVTLPDGSQVRDYPRLKHGGAHLTDPGSERTADILGKVGRGIAAAALAWSLLAAGLTFMLAHRNGLSFAEVSRAVWNGRFPVPLRAVLVTLAMVLMVVLPLATLAPHYHVLGTDKVGQDVLYLSLKSIRTGLVIGTVTTLVMLPFALALGITAGYFKGWVDDLIQYLYTTLSSIPGVLLIAAAVLMMQVYMDTHAETFDSITRRADFRLLFLCVILGVTSWTGLCRLLRGESLKLREMDYVQAARSLGVGHLRIMIRHLLPNVLHLVIVTTVLGFSGLVLAEAVLSYVGVGVDPAMNSFGTMINSARLEMAREPVVWWSLASAFAFMFTLVLTANLFADAVRDALDPRAGSSWRPARRVGRAIAARAVSGA